MINDSTAWAMVYAAFCYGVLGGFILAFAVDWALGWVAFHRSLRFARRVWSALNMAWPESDRALWLEAYNRRRDRNAKRYTLDYIRRARRDW